MPSQTEKVSVICHSQRTISLIQHISTLAIGVPANAAEHPSESAPSEAVVHSSLETAIQNVAPGFFGFIPKYEALLGHLLDDRIKALEELHQSPSKVFFPVRKYIICSKELPPQGMARPETVPFIESFDSLIQLLERCRLAGAITTGNYHSLIRRLDGSARNAFRRLRARTDALIHENGGSCSSPTTSS